MTFWSALTGNPSIAVIENVEFFAPPLIAFAAEAGESVWDVRAAAGVVAVKESDGRCAVSVYGPHAQPIL